MNSQTEKVGRKERDKIEMFLNGFLAYIPPFEENRGDYDVTFLSVYPFVSVHLYLYPPYCCWTTGLY
jgi:hypothetical protein